MTSFITETISLGVHLRFCSTHFERKRFVSLDLNERFLHQTSRVSGNFSLSYYLDYYIRSNIDLITVHYFF